MSEKLTQAAAVLEYWKAIEFLGQTDIILQSDDSKKILRRIRDKVEKDDKLAAQIKRMKKLEVFQYIGEAPDVRDVLKADRETFSEFPEVGTDFFFCMGKILRNDFVDYLGKYIPDREELPELAYDETQAIGWFSFRTDCEGNYQKDSFTLSPLLWAAMEWERRGAGQGEFALDLKRYRAAADEIVKKLEDYGEEYGEINVVDFLDDIYDFVYGEYVKTPFPEAAGKQKYRGFLEYNRYRTPSEKNKDKNPDNYADFGTSFFTDDLDRVERAVADGKFGDGSVYEKAVVDFMLSEYYKLNQTDVVERTLISPQRDRTAESYAFFKKVLDIMKAPNGKWPSKHMPALMQQVAVNLAIDNEAPTPIFSVNGPPGTGKTTLLKEILAHCIVERACLIARNAGDDPDSIFEKCKFKKGSLEKFDNSYVEGAPYYFKIKYDEINDYGVLVTSCNNSAVENITIDLPKLDDVLDALSGDDDGLKEIHDLFDPAVSKDVETVMVYDSESKRDVPEEARDILFTRYADRLLNASDDGKDEKKDDSKKIRTWGLISAPLGKRENVKAYCAAVLGPFLKDYSPAETRKIHIGRYREVRGEFLAQYQKVQQLKAELGKVCDDCARNPQGFTLPAEYAGDNKMAVVDAGFVQRYVSDDEEASTGAQLANPWATKRFNRERERLFYYACKLHKEFVASSDCMRQNIENIMVAWRSNEKCSGGLKGADCAAAFPVLLQSLFLLTPVISTTFASVGRFLSNVQRGGVIGLLVVDESGQAQPHMAAGSLYRSRKAIIVGDPKQIEPVVTAETDMFKQMMSNGLLKAYKDKKISVQGFADYINPYGTFLGQGNEREWVGCPLIVHRRCVDPMYSIANQLSYDGTMKNSNRVPKEGECFILLKSCWINVTGKEEGNKKHYVKEQGEVVLTLLEAAFKKTDGIPKLYIISPFTSVKNGMEKAIKESKLCKSEAGPRVKQWLRENNIGTVHTFQGKGTDEVIFLLGCDSTSVSAANWVNKNIVNVAATRAKQRFYMIGDEQVWKSCRPVAIAKQITDNDMTAAEINALFKDATVTGEAGGTPHGGAVPARKQSETAPEKKNSDMRRWVLPTRKSDAPRDDDEPAMCPACKKGKIVKRTGPYGVFWSCNRFPACKYKFNIKELSRNKFSDHAP